MNRVRNAHDFLDLDRGALAEILRSGHPIDATALAGYAYRGVSLGLPAIVDRVAWKTFRKCFHRDSPAAPIRGWNVRLEQNGLDAPSIPLRRRGEPFCFGHFHVVPTGGRGVPRGADRGLLLDYGLGGNAALDPTRLLRDPLVALAPGGLDLLLGWSYLEIGGLRVPTPSFFTLEREGPLDHVARAPGSR